MLPNKARILVIDDDPSLRDACKQVLARAGHDVEMADGGQKGLALVSRFSYDVILLDLRMPDMDGMTVLKHIHERDPLAVVIIITGHGSIESAVNAMRLGAFDFVSKPFTPDQLRTVVDKAREKRHLHLENAYLKQEIKRRTPGKVIYRSKAMTQVMEVAERVARTDTTVLLTGESGTGKGLLARTLHEMSARSEFAFVPVDCSTLVSTLFESELFGHVKGAFTGADANKIGKFELAGDGTLFLDEVGNISLDIQAKLLKAVEDRAICRVGSNQVIRVDTRLVAATNQDLAQAVSKGAFRQDLFYRLNVVHIHLPPLRERPEDVPLLAEHLLDRFRYLNPGRVRGFSAEAMEMLTRHTWPGNVRELANVVQRMVVLSQGPELGVADLQLSQTGDATAMEAPAQTLAEVERNHILDTLRRLGGRRGEAAKVLGIDRKTLRLKIRRHGLEPELAGLA